MLITFIINSVLLGVGLAMDAFSVSIANAMAEPDMNGIRKAKIAGTFAGFQLLMPMAGWLCVHTIAEGFQRFRLFIPWIALVLLVYIGVKMLIEGIRGQGSEASDTKQPVSNKDLLIQGVATSIDALSVGFTIAAYSAVLAFSACMIIAVETFIICETGFMIGR